MNNRKHDIKLISMSFIASAILTLIGIYILSFIFSIFPFKRYVASRSFVKEFSKHSAHIATQNSAFSMTYKLMIISAILYIILMVITVCWRKYYWSNTLNLIARQLLQALTIYGLTLSIGTGVLIIKHVFFGTLAVMAIPPLMFIFFYLELWTKISSYKKQNLLLNDYLNRIFDRLDRQTRSLNMQIHSAFPSDLSNHHRYIKIMKNLKCINKNIKRLKFTQNNNKNNVHGIFWKLLHFI